MLLFLIQTMLKTTIIFRCAQIWTTWRDKINQRWRIGEGVQEKLCLSSCKILKSWFYLSTHKINDETNGRACVFFKFQDKTNLAKHLPEVVAVLAHSLQAKIHCCPW